MFQVATVRVLAEWRSRALCVTAGLSSTARTPDTTSTATRAGSPGRGRRRGVGGEAAGGIPTSCPIR